MMKYKLFLTACIKLMFKIYVNHCIVQVAFLMTHFLYDILATIYSKIIVF